MGWLADILLESPTPPSNYLPTRRSRLALARLTLRGGAALRTLVGSHTLRDLGSAHPVGRSRTVSPDEIADELEEEIRTINPPIFQGWMVAAIVIAVIATFPGIRLMAGSGARNDEVGGALLALLPLVLVALAVAGASALISGVELSTDRVIVRSWLAWRLGRPGRDLGLAASLRAAVTPGELQLTGPEGTIAVPLRGWPPTARQEISDELPIWGVDTPFAPHASRLALRHQRRRAALERRRREQEHRDS